MNKDNKNSHADWNNLCLYIKKNILEYPDSFRFPSYFALRLQGLKKGQFIGNNNAKVNAVYDDKILLTTFMICKNQIVSYLHTNERKIKDENHKINIIMKIIESEINNVALRIKDNEKLDNNIKKLDFSYYCNDGAKYTKKTQDTYESMKKLF